MTIEELRKFRRLRAAAAYWRKELETLTYLSSPKMTGLPSAGDLGDQTSDKAIQIAELTQRIRQIEARIRKEMQRVIEWIEQIDDPLIQAIMYARYIKGSSWTAVAMQMGGNNTADGVRMMHNRYLFALFGRSKV